MGDNRLKIDKSLETMLISAERYACGRRTYIVSDTVNYILHLLPKLSDWCVGVMRQDMIDQFGMVQRTGNQYLMGDSCDYMEWSRFALALDEEVNRRSAEKAGDA